MYRNIFDSHAHYDDEAFSDDRDELLNWIFSNGVSYIINCATDLKSCATSEALAQKFQNLYFAAGVHPHEAQSAGDDFINQIKPFFKNNKCVAVGEIGLDYHYDFSPRDVQISAFEKQLEFAKENGLPVIIHNREAHEDTLNLIEKYRPRGVVHCFSGSLETAKEILACGMYIGIGGSLTFKNARKLIAVAEYCPIERILLETDCPYMAPVPHRGERNNSTLISLVAQKLAEIKNTDASEIIDITTENSKKLFNIKYR